MRTAANGCIEEATIVVAGTVRDDAGHPLERDLYTIGWVDESGDRLWAACSDGSYSLAGIRPGRWRCVATGTGFRRVEREVVVLPGSQAQREDIVIARARRVAVELYADDGRPLSQALAADPALAFVHVQVVATRAPPPPRWPANGMNADVGDGSGVYTKCARLSDRDRQSLPPSCDGRLDLLADPPLHVSVVMHHVVLTTRSLEPGVDSLSFTVAVEALRQLLSGAVLRLVDDVTGEPCLGGSVSLMNAETVGWTRKADEQGFVRYASHSPGLWRLEVRASEYAPILMDVEFEPGRMIDVGDVRMKRAVAISGRTVDPSGAPRRVWVSVLPETRSTDSKPYDHLTLLDVGTEADGEGRFTVMRGPGRWVLGFRISEPADADESSPKLAARPIVVDTTRGPVEDLIVPFEPAIEVRVKPATTEHVRFEVLDARGGTTFVQGLLDGAAQKIDLLPGEYVLRVKDVENRPSHDRAFRVADEPIVLEIGR